MIVSQLLTFESNSMFHKYVTGEWSKLRYLQNLFHCLSDAGKKINRLSPTQDASWSEKSFIFKTETLQYYFFSSHLLEVQHLWPGGKNIAGQKINRGKHGLDFSSFFLDWSELRLPLTFGSHALAQLTQRKTLVLVVLSQQSTRQIKEK